MCSRTSNPNHPLIIAITGGIGCGKSVVSEMLRKMGQQVYDCDSRAKVLMENPEIIQEIALRISKKVITPQGTLSRSRLGEIVFTNPDKLQKLNNIVHHHVRADIVKWIEQNHACQALWIETAILYQSGLDKMVDQVWEVTAPIQLRLDRVMQRNSMSHNQVQNRIDSQNRTAIPNTRNHIMIENDGITPLLPQIESLLAEING